ncbi:MAG: NAD(P)-dependent oxidoreductase [Planctomycetes bacterium]|nr:NAD(P)-dependent oxidoreductase [Planctomycetota bacterium]
MADIGFLGLGAMGLPMAKRLCAAGHRLKVTVHSNPAPAAAIVQAGGRRVEGVAAVVADVDYVVSILPEDRQIEETLLDPATMAAMGARTVIIEMTSSTPSMMRRLAAAYAERGIRCFDAPVSGGIAGARDGKLTIMAGGDAETLAAIRPVLEAMAARIFLVGGVGAGKALKAVNQLSAAANAGVVAEALQLARSQNIDLDMMYDVITASSGHSYIFANKFKKMVEDDFATGFKLSLMQKDIGIALSEAATLPMPVTSLCQQVFRMAADDEQSLDFSVISRLFRR